MRSDLAGRQTGRCSAITNCPGCIVGLDADPTNEEVATGPGRANGHGTRVNRSRRSRPMD